ncbi:hypothetical protein ACA910_006532 [Epithemia clementina (nom. ined.)]
MISAYLPAYIAATKNKDKIRITVEIISLVKNSGGRFLASDDRVLYEVSDAEARSKVSQALRHQRSLLLRDKKSKSSQVSGDPTQSRRITVKSSTKKTKSNKPKCSKSPTRKGDVALKQRSVIGCGKDVEYAHIHKIGGKLSSSCASPFRQESQKVAVELSKTQLMVLLPRGPNCLSPFQQETQQPLKHQGPQCVSPVQQEQQIVAFESADKKPLFQPLGNHLYTDIDMDEVSEFSLVEILDDDFQFLY